MLGKGEVTEEVARKTGLRKSDAARALDAVLDTVRDALSRGDEVRLTGFGSFRVASTRERIGRNPRTGEMIRIAPSRRPVFSAGSRLVQAVRGGG